MQQKYAEVTKPLADPLVWACLEAAQLQPGHLSQSWLHSTLDWALGQGKQHNTRQRCYDHQ